MVPITRSQKAFACGARTGVFRILRPIASSVRSTRLQPSVSRPRTSLRLGALAQESISRLRKSSSTVCLDCVMLFDDYGRPVNQIPYRAMTLRIIGTWS